MGISMYNIKRWIKMLMGNSIYHVTQDIGKIVDKGGYYNDLTQKVLLGEKNLDRQGIPFLEHCDGKHIKMPTMIFQYGLGAFDLYLLEEKKEYLDKVVICANWAVDNQEEKGSWNNFFYIYPDNPYSAMSQGEGASLLLRAYAETKDIRYFNAAKKAIDFMLIDVSCGGVSERRENELYLLEYTHLPLVLNGWIFALWGIYDLSLVLPEYKKEFDKTVNTLARQLLLFDNGYWSLYDVSVMMTSPFYHKLHIAQLKAMYQITNIDIFKEMSLKFEKYESKKINRIRAFCVKGIQKILE